MGKNTYRIFNTAVQATQHVLGICFVILTKELKWNQFKDDYNKCMIHSCLLISLQQNVYATLIKYLQSHYYTKGWNRP